MLPSAAIVTSCRTGVVGTVPSMSLSTAPRASSKFELRRQISSSKVVSAIIRQ